MFGILKKKLKESVEKISKRVSKKDEIPVERIEEESEKVIKEQIKEEEIEEKKKLLEDAGFESEKVEEVLEKPYQEPITESEKEEVQEEVEEVPEKIIEEIPTEPEHVIKQISEEKVIEEVKEEIKEKPKKKGLLQKFRKKKEPKEEKKSVIEKLRKKITEKEIKEEDVKDVLWDLHIGLIESDVAVEVAEKITEDLKKALLGQSAKKKQIEKIVKESLEKSIFEIIDVNGIDLVEKVKEKKPYVILFLGFNGSGKTTTIARIGHLLKQNNISCVLAAGDTWRAASIEQLEEHGRNLGINVIKQKYGSDPAAVIFDAVKHAQSNDVDVVLADTAGRSHANVNLIEELKKIVRVNTPDMKVLVVDALTGNDVVDQSKVFTDAVGIDALILTKTDVYEKGGAILSAIHTTKKPILYLGVGQDYGDLEKLSDIIVDMYQERERKYSETSVQSRINKYCNIIFTLPVETWKL